MKIVGIHKINRTAGIMSGRNPVIDRAPTSYEEDQGRKPPTGLWCVWWHGFVRAEFQTLADAKYYAGLLES